MREATKKMLLGFLAITLVMPTVFFMRPQKAEALVSLAQCLIAKLTEGGTALGKAAAAAIAFVGTSDTVGTEVDAESGAGTSWSACFLKGLTRIIAKTLLHTFTQSIVNWINTGFEGSPSFVTNPEGFFNDIADQTIGRIIEDISPLLCSPFKLDIRFALGLNLSLNTKEEIHCRLSDVMANVRGAYDGFVQGAAGSGNLSNWIHIAGTPQNNPYGAYIATTNKLSLGITTATGQQKELLNWGKGFKSWRSCEKRGPDVEVVKNGQRVLQADEVTPVTRKGPCLKEGPIKTPGSIIESNTTGALATTFRELELANEIDEVVGALINQLLVKTMTGIGGLLGASKGDITNNGQSAVDALLTDPNVALAGADSKTPDGINCRVRYYPSTREESLGSKVYVADDSRSQVWTDNLGVGRNVNIAASDIRPLVEAWYLKEGDATPIRVEKEVGLSWATYFEKVKAGCANEWNTLITNASAKGLGAASGGGAVVPGGGTPPPPPPQIESGNIALRKSVAQSSTAIGQNDYALRAENAVDGSRDGNLQYGLALTEDVRDGWWSIDLESDQNGKHQWKETKIDSVRIYGSIKDRALRYAPPFKVFVTALPVPRPESLLQSGGTLVGNGPTGPVDGNVMFDGPVNPALQGRFLYIVQTGHTSQLGLSEVEIIGTQTRSDSSGNTPTPAVPFAFTDIPPATFKQAAQGNGWNPGATFLWNSITFTPNKTQGNITFRARYFECPSLGTEPVPAACPESTNATHKVENTEFRTNLSELIIASWIDGAGTTKSMIQNTGSGYEYTADAEVAPTVRETGISFAKNVTLKNTTPITVSVNGTPRANKPFRIVIEALENIGTQTERLVGSAKADFVR